MAVLATEPTALALAGPQGLDPQEQRHADQLQHDAEVAKTLAEIALVLGGAFLLYQHFAVRRMLASLPPKPTPTTLRMLSLAAWRMFQPTWWKVTVPAVATAYGLGVIDAKRGEVPQELLYLFAEQYTHSIGDYFNDTSATALEEGFNAYVNKKLPNRVAAERVIKAYGLTPRQMRAVVAGEQLGAMRVTSTIEMKTDGKTERFIETQLLRRAHEIGENEAFTAMRRGKLLTWMYLLKHEKFPASAKKVWVTAHDEKVCKVCGPLDGKKAAITEPFKSDIGPIWVPALHPNCRCDIILDVPIRDLFTKRFDPTQPRDDHGRWSEASSKLNAMPVVPGRVETKFRQARHTVGYVANPRYVTTPLKQRDKDLARLAHGAVLWSAAINNVDRARKIDAGTNAYFSRKMRAFKSDEALGRLVHAVQDAPANAPDLYRGVVVNKDQLKKLDVGQTMDLPLSSFTTDMDMASAFATKFGWRFLKDRDLEEKGFHNPAEYHPVVFVVENGAKALHISPLVAERQAEWITKGTFEIIGMDEDEHLTFIDIAQVSTDEPVAKADWWVGEGWEEEEHPRDREGRFAVKTRPIKPPPTQTGVDVIGGGDDYTGTDVIADVAPIPEPAPPTTGVAVIGAEPITGSLDIIEPTSVDVIGGGVEAIPATTVDIIDAALDRQARLDELLQMETQAAAIAAAQAVPEKHVATKMPTGFVWALDPTDENSAPIPMVSGKEKMGAIVPFTTEQTWMTTNAYHEELGVRLRKTVDELVKGIYYEHPTLPQSAEADSTVRRVVLNELLGREPLDRKEARETYGIRREDHMMNVYLTDEAPSKDLVDVPYLPNDDGTFTIPHPMEVTWIQESDSEFPVRFITLRPSAETTPIEDYDYEPYEPED